MYTEHRSKIDQSVNFVKELGGSGKFECRFVRRVDDYFIVYLSSQSGCDLACRMCHLTATGQNKGVRDASYWELMEQANTVLAHYDYHQPSAHRVHFNFMARGEPLQSETILSNGTKLMQALMDQGRARGLESACLISTIMPFHMLDVELEHIFRDRGNDPDIYYSLYSLDPQFRKRWLPRSMDPTLALEKLKHWQETTGKIPKIHWAFIKDENDDQGTLDAICEATHRLKLRVNMNVVRYNPYSSKYGQESDIEVIERNTRFLNENLYGIEQIRIVPRVGSDVQASCGMFVS